MEATNLALQLTIMLLCIWLGSRKGGIALGFWGGVGLLIITFGFRQAPAEPPVDVMLIILAVTCATAAMEAAGGIAFLVRIAEGIIRRYPQRITIIAPLVAYVFTFAAGTGHILYPLLPVIHDTALRNGIRPERPMSVAVVASLQGITASPVSAAMAALIVVVEPLGMSLPQIMMIAVPATIVGVFVASLVMLNWGKELEDDPVFLERVASGEVEDIPAYVKARRMAKRQKISMDDALVKVLGSEPTAEEREALVALAEHRPVEGNLEEDAVAQENGAKPGSPRIAAAIFLLAVVIVVVLGAVPSWRPPNAEGDPLNIAIVIQMVMLGAAAMITTLTGVDVKKIATSSIARTGLIAIVGIFGLAWLGLSVIEANKDVIVNGLEALVSNQPWTFAIALFAASIVLFSQASTTRTLMPLGAALGLAAPQMVAMWPAVNGAFFLPTYGTIVAALNFDRSGTSKIGNLVLNHSFMVPGVVAVISAVATGLLISGLY